MAQGQSTEKESSVQPYFAQLHYGGNLGRYSIGAGKYFFGDKFLLSLHYGLTPSEIEGANSVQSLSLKNTFIPTRVYLTQKFYGAPEFGWAISYSGNMPLPLLMFGGVRVESEFENSLFSLIGAYFHVGTNGTWLSYAADNTDVRIDDLYNLSIGLQFNF